jgi:hypothetical protein
MTYSFLVMQAQSNLSSPLSRGFPACMTATRSLPVAGGIKSRTNMSTDTKHLESFTIPRDGLPFIHFAGISIGRGSTRVTDNVHNGDRWTVVEIYRTRAGNYVVVLEQHTCWVGGQNCYTASSVKTAAEAVDWLKQGKEFLGPAAELAVRQATKVDESFKSWWTEEVD